MCCIAFWNTLAEGADCYTAIETVCLPDRSNIVQRVYEVATIGSANL